MALRGKKNTSTLAKFIDKIMGATPKNDLNTIVYRGQSRAGEPLVPSLFREENALIRQREMEIFKDVEVMYPMEFKDESTTLDKLAIMRHHELPTRLLDITYNPLVALYFAALGDIEKDGELFILEIHKSSVKFFDSDTVSCLSNLVHMDTEEKEEIHSFVKGAMNMQWWCDGYHFDQDSEIIIPNTLRGNVEFIANILHYFVCDIESYPKLNGLINRIRVKKDIHELINKEKTLIDEAIYQECVPECREFINNNKEKLKSHFEFNSRSKIFNKTPLVERLVHFIQAEKGYFKPQIICRDLRRVICVKVKQSDPRIIAQDGAFLLFGLEEKLEETPDDFFNLFGGVKIIKIPVGKEYKKNLLSELAQVGIAKKALYSGLDSVIDHIKNKYKYQQHEQETPLSKSDKK